MLQILKSTNHTFSEIGWKAKWYLNAKIERYVQFTMT